MNDMSNNLLFLTFKTYLAEINLLQITKREGGVEVLLEDFKVDGTLILTWAFKREP